MPSTPATPRPVTAADKVDLVDTLIGTVKPMFTDLADRAGNYPEFIRSNEDRSPLFDAVRGVARLNCRIWASSDKSGYSTRANAGNAELCGPYLEQLGEMPPDGALEREFEGGQCAVTYRVAYTSEVYPFSDCSTFGPGNSDIGLAGPILGTVKRTVNPSGDLCTPGGNYIYLRHGNPVQETLLAGAGYGATVTNLSVTREDGLPDNCGSPDPTIQPPGTVTPATPVPPSITVNLPGLGPVEVTVELTATGDPVICIPILGVCEQIVHSPGTDEPGGGDGGGGGGGGAGPGTPGGDESTGPGGVAEGAAPDGSELVGLLVTVTGTPEEPNTFDNNAATVYRGIGYVGMGFPGRLGLDISGGTVISPQFFHAQQPGLTDWAVRANVGFTLRVTPYYREITS